MPLNLSEKVVIDSESIGFFIRRLYSGSLLRLPRAIVSLCPLISLSRDLPLISATASLVLLRGLSNAKRVRPRADACKD